MRTWYGPNAVYNGRDQCVGFRCGECGEIVPSMWGDTCNACREKERRHRETIAALNAKKERDNAEGK